MTGNMLDLPDDAEPALATIIAASAERPILIFKKSPICPISHDAERQLRLFLGDQPSDSPLSVAEIDVIAQRSLARGLVAALGIEHESPQALLFDRGGVRWHASHGTITAQRLRDEVAACNRAKDAGP